MYRPVYLPVSLDAPPLAAPSLALIPVPIPAGLQPGLDPVPKVAPVQAATAPRPSAYEALHRYTEAEARIDPAERPRRSAALAAPASLSPARADCSIRPPAVLFDLDPADAVFDPAAMTRADSALLAILPALRAQEIDVFWISQLPAWQAGSIRESLNLSGLDPKGDDRLLLIRRAADRKQALRQDVQASHCLIAIAGDIRSDFDELYLYLKAPELAQPLEQLLGAGWFLAPLPLIQGS